MSINEKFMKMNITNLSAELKTGGYYPEESLSFTYNGKTYICDEINAQICLLVPDFSITNNSSKEIRELFDITYDNIKHMKALLKLLVSYF